MRLFKQRVRNYLRNFISDFFLEKGYLEAETPLFNRFWTTEPWICPVRCVLESDRGKVTEGFLSPSPEINLKKILVKEPALKGVFEFARCFRNHEEPQSTQHSFEFTMLEWYERKIAYLKCASELTRLILLLAEHLGKSDRFTAAQKKVFTERNVYKKWTWLSVEEAFLRYAEIDFSCFSSWAELLEAGNDVLKKKYVLFDDVFWAVMLEKIEPHFRRLEPLVLYDFPAFQAGFTQTFKRNSLTFAKRFELFCGNVELANGGQEIVSASEMRAVYEKNNRLRQKNSLPVYDYDRELICLFEERAGAMSTPFSGVALGFDRLVMLLTGGATLEAFY